MRKGWDGIKDDPVGGLRVGRIMEAGLGGAIGRAKNLKGNANFGRYGILWGLRG
jgi:hypothetical protein